MPPAPPSSDGNRSLFAPPEQVLPISPDYSYTVCYSGGIIRPDCVTRSGCPSFDLLGVLHEYACGGLSRDVLSRRRFRRFATTAYE